MKKVLISLTGGLVLAFVIFVSLQTLIEEPSEIVKESRESRSFEFVRHKKDTKLEERKRVKPKPPKPEPKTPDQLNLAQAPIKMPAMQAPPTTLPAFKLSNIQAANAIGFANVAQANMSVIPLVRIAPQYPKNALRAKKEGYVTLSFTVKADGGVKNVKVIDAKPARIFDKAAIRAIKKWKFKAKVVNGTKVEQQGQQTITFSLKKR